jgi:AcrR family transcriptional regulator
MGRAKFDEADFTGAALAIAAERGPFAVTVGSITERLGAPTGSFYHRFASRDVLLGELWLRTVLDFQQGLTASLDAGDGLGAALHTPAWVREHLDEARLLLLYHRDDFVQGGWPEALRGAVAAQTEQMTGGFARFAHLVFGQAGQEELRLAQFLLAEVPVAVVRQHLQRREPPPPIVDELIRLTYRAVVADYHARAGDADPEPGDFATRE